MSGERSARASVDERRLLACFLLLAFAGNLIISDPTSSRLPPPHLVPARSSLRLCLSNSRHHGARFSENKKQRSSECWLRRCGFGLS